MTKRKRKVHRHGTPPERVLALHKEITGRPTAESEKIEAMSSSEILHLTRCSERRLRLVMEANPDLNVQETAIWHGENVKGVIHPSHKRKKDLAQKTCPSCGHLPAASGRCGCS